MQGFDYDKSPIPSEEDQTRFLLRAYFGAEGDLPHRIVQRAYLDLSRTVHGIGLHPDAPTQAASELRAELASLPEHRHLVTQQWFDDWHEAMCSRLRAAFASGGYNSFTVGQAQKWINMALKYVFLFGERRLQGYGVYYPYCHVPIDNIVLRSPAFAGMATFTESWSRIRDYSAYMAFQRAVRERYAPAPPLAVEFRAWLE